MAIAEIYIASHVVVCRVVGGVLEQYFGGDWITPTNPQLLAAWNDPTAGRTAKTYDGYYCLWREPCVFDPAVGGAKNRTETGNVHPGGTCEYCNAWPPGGTVYHIEQAELVPMGEYTETPGSPASKRDGVFDLYPGMDSLITIQDNAQVNVYIRP